MGGLTSLMLAHGAQYRVASFTDIEGNVAPEDCFLSRQIFLHPHEDPALFLEDFIARNWVARYYASPAVCHQRAVQGAHRSRPWNLRVHGGTLGCFYIPQVLPRSMF